MSSSTFIQAATSEDGAVLTLTMNGGRGNILTIALCRELRAALAAASNRPRLALLVIRGAGGVFSYGASVEEHLPGQAPAMLAALGDVVRALAAFPCPTLAAIEGRCLGGGLEVALACRLIAAEADAVLGCPEIRLGVFAPAATAILAGRLPRAIASDLLLTGRNFSAAEAERWGLVNTVVATGGMDTCITAIAARLRPLSPSSLRIATRALSLAESAATAPLEDSLEEQEAIYRDSLMPLPDATEGLRAFLEKRSPAWENAR